MEHPKNGKIIAFYNRKGGVGKTTLSGNFAALLAKLKRREGKTVMYLDLDSQSNAATTYLGYNKEDLLKPADSYPNILNLVGIDAPSLNIKLPKLPLKSIVSRTNLNLWTIPPHGDMELYWKKTPSYEDNYSVFVTPFSNLRKNFDYIVIDLPPAQDDMTISALAASDYLIIPVDSDSKSVDSISRLSTEFIPIFKDINPNFTVLGIVANKFDRYDDAFYETVLKSLSKENGISLYKTKIRTSAGLKDPNNRHEGYFKNLRARSKLDRCVVAFDDFIFKTYPKAYEDIKKFTEETLKKMGE